MKTVITTSPFLNNCYAHLPNPHAKQFPHAKIPAATVVTKTTAVIAQGSKAAASGTGFSAGIELDIDAIEKQLKAYEERSVASNLSANNINIKSGNKTSIQGSNLNANDGISIEAKTTEIVASKDTSNSDTDTQHQNINLSFGTSGTSASVSADSSKSSANQTNYTNATLQANNIKINTTETTTIIGANLNADESLSLNTKNLEVASVQNSSKSKSNSQGMSAGFGASGLSSAGANMSNANSNSKQTLLTSLTSNKVDITVEDETKLRGATIAAVDSQGNDNGQLSLSTTTLIASSLNNTNSSKSTSVGGNLGFAENVQKDDQDNVILDKDGKPVTQTGISSVGIDFANDTANSKTKTLATLGNGNIQIADKENSDTKMLNSDIANNEVDIYNISSHKGLKGELDTRLLTEDGRNQIKDDAITSSAITNAIEQIATSDRAGVLDFFTETEKNVKVYEGMKKELTNNPELAQQLSDPNLTPQDKQAMLQNIANTVAISLGYNTNEMNLVSTDEKGANGTEVKGHFGENKETYVNDRTNSSTADLIATTGHETQHSMDNQAGTLKLNDTDQNNYADNFGGDVSFYTSNALDQTYDKSLASTNSHNSGQITTTPSVFNDNTFAVNNPEFAGLDKSKGDDSIYLYGGKVVATDGVNDHKVIDLTFGESFQFRNKDKYANLKDGVQVIEPEDTSKYINVYNLENQNDFEALRQGTDMNYNNINDGTKIVMVTGMNNGATAAKNIQGMIGKDFNNVGLINNQTDEIFGVVGDAAEWMPNSPTTKDVLNAEMLQRVSPNTLVVSHSAGNEDIYKANEVNALVGVQTPYNLISAGSPKSKTALEESASKVGATVITQINNPHDPVANGYLNNGANYEIDKNPITDLFGNHSFDNYYNNGVKEELMELIKVQNHE